MSWNNIEKQHQSTFSREYVACHEPAERSWLVEQVIAAFPNWRKSIVERAIQEVCAAMVITPRLRKDFLEQLQHNLEGRRTPTSTRPKKNTKV